MTFKIHERGKFAVVEVEGDIESEVEARRLTDEISRLAGKGHIHFCMDMEEVTYLNSSGISIFIHALAEADNRKGSVYLVIREPHVRNVVELAGLDKLIKTYSSMEEFEKEHLSA